MRTIFILLVAGAIAFVAYTYGAKAGRGKYREIRAALDAIWNDPTVKKARKKAAKESEKLAKAAEKRAYAAVKGH